MTRMSRSIVATLARTLCTVAALVVVMPSGAAQPQATKPVVVDAYARATPPGARTAGVYLTIRNRAGAADELVGASTPVAADVEMHTMSHEGGMMRMRAVDKVPVPAGGAVELAPGGLHLMLIDPREPLREGARFPLTLRFARAGAVEAEVRVRGVGGGSGPGR
jgi:copper(I)-binding protein